MNFFKFVNKSPNVIKAKRETCERKFLTFNYKIKRFFFKRFTEINCK
jgi:hypothetical protein